MQHKQTLVLPAIIMALTIAAFAFFSFSNNVKTATGSIGTFESYYSTTTNSTAASGTVSSNICLGQCQLGSLVVTQVGTAGYVRIWNATSTATSTYQWDQASTTAAITWGKAVARVLGSSDAAGTLVFDTMMTNGIVIETSTGFDGEYIVTWKK